MMADDPFGIAGRARSVAKTYRRPLDRKSTRLNSSHTVISYAVFCLKKKDNYILAHDRCALRICYGAEDAALYPMTSDGMRCQWHYVQTNCRHTRDGKSLRYFCLPHY